jgi:hypothetical protein
VFAGGSGTRFFQDQNDISEDFLRSFFAKNRKKKIPKGLVPVTPVANFTFLELFASQILETGIETGRMPVFLIMTSSITDRMIRKFIENAELCGFPHTAIIIFRQEENPRLDSDGIPIVNEKGCLLWTGNGHGGIFRALLKGNGTCVAETLKNKEIRYLMMHNVDNALAKPLMPERLGFHISGKYALTLSAFKRDDPQEKIGIIARKKDSSRIEVIEYSVCDPEVKNAVNPETGELLIQAGHPNTNIISLDCLKGDVEPTLYMEKPVRVGRKIIQSSTFEILNQHITRNLHPSEVGIYEVDRKTYFLPTKSIAKIDSLIIARKKISELALETFIDLGARVSGTGHEPVLEIHPCLGNSPVKISRTGAGSGWSIGNGCRIFLGVLYGINGSKPYGENLVIEDNAVLIIKARAPYGKISYNEQNRAVSADPLTAGRICMGNNVRIKQGACIRISINGSGIVKIPDNTVLQGNIDLTVTDGSCQEL